MDKKVMFSLYNKARSAAHNGKLDELRVNRALGVLQSADGEDTLAKYQTTISSCNCPDRKHHKNQPCKHMIAKMVLYRANQQTAQPKPKVQSDNVDNPYVNIDPTTGQVIMAEQQSSGYVLHTFENLEQYVAWRNQHTGLQMVKPHQVKGNKIGVVDHREF